MDVDTAELQQMLQTYTDSGEKNWLKSSVTIDGTTFDQVGIKLKGNSSLRGADASSAPETLPWRIRLDKYVEGQNLDGYSDFTVRANSSATSLNEAVALDLLGDAGLATEHAIATRFSVNGSDAVLRLTVQNLDETWAEQNFPDAGTDSILYKSDADGDWSWRGTDGDYTSAFDVDAGPDDYTPLIELLNLLHNGTAEEITEKLPQLVDLDSLATYLAFEDMIDNFDDIDGPGNNSYLFWDSATDTFTVVAWDHNLAFGASPGRMSGTAGPPEMAGPGGTAGPPGTGNGGGPGGFPGGRPGRGDGDGDGDGQAGAGRPGGTENPLVKAFEANSTWKAGYAAAQTRLRTELISSGALAGAVDAWVDILTVGASELVSPATIAAEADKIRAYAD